MNRGIAVVGPKDRTPQPADREPATQAVRLMVSQTEFSRAVNAAQVAVEEAPLGAGSDRLFVMAALNELGILVQRPEQEG